MGRQSLQSLPQPRKSFDLRFLAVTQASDRRFSSVAGPYLCSDRSAGPLPRVLHVLPCGIGRLRTAGGGPARSRLVLLAAPAADPGWAGRTRWSSGRGRAKTPTLVAALRHFDNRDGFPLLHDHCLVLNRVQRPDDDGEPVWGAPEHLPPLPERRGSRDALHPRDDNRGV
ncbi:relaxase domain-containing protein [Streptomyces sp. NPDC001142]